MRRFYSYRHPVNLTGKFAYWEKSFGSFPFFSETNRYYANGGGSHRDCSRVVLPEGVEFPRGGLAGIQAE
jgi:hypothetical protein